MNRPASFAIILACGLASVGCGRAALERTLPAPDAGDAAVETNVSTGAEGCPSATACNDDPTAAAIAGICMIVGDQAQDWICQCNDGFSNNPETGLCRVGSTCVASGADEWSYSDALDSSDCALRPILACAAGPPMTEQRITGALTKLITDACGSEYGLMVRIEHRGGCPMLLEAKRWRGSLVSLDLTFLQCIEALLPKVRFDCDEPRACALLEWQSPGPIP